MSEIDAATLMKRVDDLESRLRRLRRLIGGTVLAGAIVMGAAAGFGGHVLADTAHSGVVKARAFEVVDADGNVTAALGPTRMVQPNSRQASSIELDLRNAPGESEIRLIAGPALSRLSLNSGVPGPSVTVETGFFPGVSIAGYNSKKLYLGSSLKGFGVDVTTTSHSYEAFLGLATSGAANVELESRGDHYLTHRLVLGSIQLPATHGGSSAVTPESSITAFDRKGNVIARWPGP